MDTGKTAAKHPGQKRTQGFAVTLTRLAILALALLVPVLLAKQGRDLKAYAAQCIILAALSSLPFSLSKSRRLSPIPAGIVAAFIFWLAALAAATLYAPVPSGRDLVRHGLFASTFLVVPLVFYRSELERLVSVLFLGFAGAGAYAFMQRFGFDPVEEFRLFRSNERVFSTFGNPDFLGAFLALLLPLAAAFTAGRPRARIPGIILVASIALILLWTGSRGAWLGAALGLCAWSYLSLSFAKIKRYIPRTLGAAVICCVLLVATGQFPYASLFRPTDRPLLWKGTLAMIRERPLLGWGLGSFPAEFPPFAPPVFAQRMRTANTFAEHPHCEYLNVATESGVVGLGVFFWFLTALLSHAARSVRGQGTLPKAAFGSVIAILAHAAFDRNFRLASTAVPFWILCGMFFVPARSEPRFPIHLQAFKALSSYLFLAACLLLSAWILRPLHASYRVAAETNFLGRPVDISARRLELQRVRRASDPAYFMQLGDTYARAGEFISAIEAYRETIRLAPSWSAAYNNLGNSLFMLSRFDEAIQAYRRVLEHDPNHNDARFNLAYAYYHQRRIKEAARECDFLLRADPHNPKALQLRGQLGP